MDAALGRVACHRAQIAMDHWLAADEEQVADVIFHRDVHDALRLVQRDAAARLRIKLGAREAAKAAVGVADVGDGKLQIARPAVIEDFAD